jgi:GAF domain-containing protein
LDLILESLPRIDTATLLLFKDEKGQIREIFSRSRPALKNSTAFFDQKVIDQVFRNAKTVRISNTHDAAPQDLSDEKETLKIGSVLCFPLISGAVLHGVLYIDSLQGQHRFRKQDILILEGLTGPLAVIIEKALIAAKLLPDAGINNSW